MWLCSIWRGAEAQRAADAGALAGAKMLVDIGVTTDPCNSALATTAQALAQTQAQNVAAQDLVAGPAPSAKATFPNGTQTSRTALGPVAFQINPQVKVVVTRQNLPIFFARSGIRDSHFPALRQADDSAEL